jgi:hypothetical protein
MISLRHFFASIALGCATVASASAQSSSADAARVTVSINADGSRTVYEFDPMNHKAVATTTTPDGKLRGKINYTLDDAGRFSTGEVHGADGALLFKTLYKYDALARIEQETQLNKDDAVLHKLVYSYDANGKQSGYSVYDAAGKLVSRTGGGASAKPAASPDKSKRKPAGPR